MTCAKPVLFSLVVASFGGGSTLFAQERHVEVIRMGEGAFLRMGEGAFLGVTLEEVAKDDVARLKLGEERGALVKGVESESPAQKAGLKADDVILRFQGESVHTAAQLGRLVRETPMGRTVALEVSRGGAIQKLSVALGERRLSRPREWRFGAPDLRFEMPELPSPPDMPLLQSRSRAPRKLGIEYQEITDQLAKYFKLSEDRGILVSHVDQDGAAGKAGVKAGDVIVKVGTKGVRDGSDLREELGKAEAGEDVTITVQRDGRPLDLKVKLAGTSTRRARRTDI